MFRNHVIILKMTGAVMFQASRTILFHAERQKQWLYSDSSLIKRNLWAFLNPIFNKVDEARVKECGPDRAAAEWMIRCGGAVRWQGSDQFHENYNTIPSGRMVVEGLDATGSCIMDVGFSHLKNLNHLKELNLTSCRYIDDNCLRLLAMYQQAQLQKLLIVSCGCITDSGLAHLTSMKALKSLMLSDLKSVDNPGGCVNMLVEKLPECKVEFPQKVATD